MPASILSPRRGIKDVFYETRVLMRPRCSTRRFAEEVLHGQVHPVALAYIEKGTRLPSDALVRRLAEVRREDPRHLLALLYRDRIVHAVAKELRRVLKISGAVGGVEDADLVALVFEAVAALPAEEEWIPVGQWRKRFRDIARRRDRPAEISAAMVAQVEETLIRRGLAEKRAGKVRRKGYHFVATDSDERQAMALDFCALFAKGLLDKLVLLDADTGTYLRNHYLYLEPDELALFQKELDTALRKLRERFAKEPTSTTRFLNVLVTSTPVE